MTDLSEVYELINRAKREPVQVSEEYWRMLVRLKDATGRYFVNLRAEHDPGARLSWLDRWTTLQESWAAR